MHSTKKEMQVITTSLNCSPVPLQYYRILLALPIPSLVSLAGLKVAILCAPITLTASSCHGRSTDVLYGRLRGKCVTQNRNR